MTNEVIKNHAIRELFSKTMRKELDGISEKYSRSRNRQEKKKRLVPKTQGQEEKERKRESASQSYTIFFSGKSPCQSPDRQNIANHCTCIHSIHRDSIPCFSDALFLWIREFIIHKYPSFNAESCESNPPLNQENVINRGGIPVLYCDYSLQYPLGSALLEPN